jgi:predicted kinase
MLIVVAGLPGSGKSTLADALAVQLKAPVLAVDPIENAILSAGVRPGWEAGVAAYEAAGAMAVANLLLGLTVIVDSVSDSEAARQTWWTAAERAAAPTKVIEVRCSDAVEHRCRLEHRRRGSATSRSLAGTTSCVARRAMRRGVRSDCWWTARGRSTPWSRQRWTICAATVRRSARLSDVSHLQESAYARVE